MKQLICLLFLLFLYWPAAAQDALSVSDLEPATIDRAMMREASRGEKLVQLLAAQKAEAKAKLDGLEKRYQELRLAAYYQDYSNFFYLTYYCRSISALRRECTGGRFPFSQTITRMEMALQRYSYLRQALEEVNPGALSPEAAAAFRRAHDNCAKLETDYRALYQGLMDEQQRYEELTGRIRRLDIYANGQEVEMYTAVNGGHSAASLRRIANRLNVGKDAPQATEPSAAREKKPQSKGLEEFVHHVEESANAYGSEQEIAGSVSLREEQLREGRLAARIALAMWDPLHPDRQLNMSFSNVGVMLAYLGKAYYNHFADPVDVDFGASLRAVGLVFMAVVVGSVLCCLLLYRLLLHRLHFSRARLRAFMLPLGCLFSSIGMGVFSLWQHLGYMASHTQVLAVFLLLSAVLFSALAIRLSSRRVISGVLLFLPLFVLNLLLVSYCVTMSNTFMVALTSPVLFLICGIWMLVRFLRRMSRLRIAARVFAVLSFLSMFLGVYLCAKGYYYVMILAELCWYVFVTNTMLMTAIAKLGKLLCRRISASRRLRGYRHYLCMWVQLVIIQMVLPLLFLALVWYGLRWPAEAFDLEQFLSSWMGTPHHLGGAIRSVSADKLVLIFTVGIGTNCLVQITRRTLAMIYGQRAEAGRSQMIVTVGGMAVWGAFIIFALNQLDADYSSILVVMGGMSVGVGLGMKDTIDNLVSGLSLMLGRMRPGDVVECDGVRGSVASIGYRTTTLETVDGSVICFQNSQLFTQNFRNMTRNHQYERCVVNIGVTYGTDVARARRLILQALRRLPGLSTQHSTSVLLDNFGDSSVDLSIVVWVPVTLRVAMLSRVREIIYNTFNENGIEIPFPQQDLHIINGNMPTGDKG